MLRIGILASTRGSDMQAIIDEIEKGLDAKIACVISDKKDAYALERARKHNIDAIFIHPKGKTREEFDNEIDKELKKRNVELVLLIGYMRILSNWFVNEWRNKIMNIHPSLLPAFAGGMDKDVHKAVLEHGCKVSGCTLHFVTENLDAGQIIMQKAVDIDENESVDSLKEKVQKAEQEIILKAIRLFAKGKLKVEGKRVRILD